MVLLSWLSLCFFGQKRHIKRFLPASVLIFFVEALNVQFAKKRKWWVFYNKPKSYVSGELPFNIGPFSALSMWVLKGSYGNFKRFLLLNAIFHSFLRFYFNEDHEENKGCETSSSKWMSIFLLLFL